MESSVSTIIKECRTISEDMEIEFNDVEELKVSLFNPQHNLFCP
jgi:hypothetical protein